MPRKGVSIGDGVACSIAAACRTYAPSWPEGASMEVLLGYAPSWPEGASMEVLLGYAPVWIEEPGLEMLPGLPEAKR